MQTKLRMDNGWMPGLQPKRQSPGMTAKGRVNHGTLVTVIPEIGRRPRLGYPPFCHTNR